MPAVVIGQPAANRRADGRAERRGHSEDRHADGLFGRRQERQDGVERERNQRAAGDALAGAEQNHHVQAGGKGAEHGENQEAGGAENQVTLERKNFRHDPADSNCDNFRDQISGGNPGTFRDRGTQRAGNIIQRRVGNLDVQHRHERAQHNAK